jgi:hypothetical protein
MANPGSTSFRVEAGAVGARIESSNKMNFVLSIQRECFMKFTKYIVGVVPGRAWPFSCCILPMQGYRSEDDIQILKWDLQGCAFATLINYVEWQIIIRYMVLDSPVFTANCISDSWS